MTDSITRARLLPKEDRRLIRGHLWAYRNEFAELPGLDDGAVVDVHSADGRFVGRGFFQAQGGIAVRILDWRQTDIDAQFLNERLDNARAFREQVFPGEQTYRWVYGESDGLPGLVVDRYGPVVVLHSACAFYHEHLETLAGYFLAADGITGVRTECGGQVRTFGETPGHVECSIDGISVHVNLAGGQKTGLFLDQRMNWPTIRRYAPGKRVFDGHCYAGLWSLHAAAAGAQHVTAVDTSAPALDQAQANAERNDVSKQCAFERRDVLEALQDSGDYGVVVLDPPALAKTRAQERKALGLYQALNAAAMKAIEPGGILITSSCSHFVTQETFLEILKRAATSVHKHIWVLEARGASLDHPVLMAMPETSYLKCVTLRVF